MSEAITIDVGEVKTVVVRPNTSGGDQPGNPVGLVTWLSDDTSKATVVGIGSQMQAANITGVAVGSTTVHATTAFGKTDTITVTVEAAEDPQGITILVSGPLVV